MGEWAIGGSRWRSGSDPLEVDRVLRVCGARYHDGLTTMVLPHLRVVGPYGDPPGARRLGAKVTKDREMASAAKL